MERRTFVKGALAGAGLLATGTQIARADAINQVTSTLGVETRSAGTPVKHLVIVMMENRSVDHYLGWYHNENPAFDGRQTLTFPDPRPGAPAPSMTTANWGVKGRGNFHGRGFDDPSHGWAGGRAERNGGACNGWLDPGTGNDEFALSYYGAEDLPVWAQLVRGYQSYDRFFASLLGPTQPNRYYIHSGQSGGLKSNDLPPEVAQDHPEWTFGWDWPTMWTLFRQYGVTCGYYFCNLPQLAFWGPRHADVCHHISQFYAWAAAGQLPQVSFIDPWYTAPNGIACDDHPHADLRLGQTFLSGLVEAFTTSPQYDESAMVITYDEWGGFFDHVDPPQVADDLWTPADPGGDDDFGQLGFRVPATIISPWTRSPAKGRGRVDHTSYHGTSVTKFISDNWSLPYLTRRHREAQSILPTFRGFKHHDPAIDFEPYQAPPELLVEPTMEDVENGQVPDASLPIATSDLHRLAEMGWFDDGPWTLGYRFEDSFLRAPVLR